jgi:hypothetical protein
MAVEELIERNTPGIGLDGERVILKELGPL